MSMYFMCKYVDKSHNPNSNNDTVMGNSKNWQIIQEVVKLVMHATLNYSKS